MKCRFGDDKTYLSLLIKILVVPLLTIIYTHASCQVSRQVDSVKADSIRAKNEKDNNTDKQFDFYDLTYRILHHHKKPKTVHKSSGIIVVPNISSNPTIGQQIGIKAVAGKRLGNDPTTNLSIAATSASVTTKGIVYFYISHNIFTPGNKWNFQGNLVAAKTVTPDDGLGIGKGQDIGSAAENILADPTHKPYSIKSYFFNAREKAYKEVAKNLFVGAGLDLA